MLDVPIRDDAIRLGQLLKLANLVSSGANVKEVLASGELLVNGQPETRRGRMLRPGDEVAIGDASIRVTRREVATEQGI